MPRGKSRFKSVADHLHAAGVVFDCVENLPPKVVREAMRRDFPNMRSMELPSAVIRSSLQQPLLSELLVTRIGFSGPTPGHYIPRPEGSLDYVLHHCVKGLGWLEMHGKRWSVGPDTIICIPAGTPHSYGASARSPWSIYWIHFTGTRAGDYDRFMKMGLDSPLIHMPHVSEVFQAFEAIWAAMKSVHTTETLVHASIRAAHYFGLIQGLRHAEDPRSRATDDAIRESITLMTKSLGANLSLGELAQLADMSVTRYTVAFRKTTGCSPKEYFNRLKIQRACELLLSTGGTVKEIARQVGFADPYYFSNAFRRITGASPEKYRRK